jgi:hypothetical protein
MRRKSSDGIAAVSRPISAEGRSRSRSSAYLTVRSGRASKLKIIGTVAGDGMPKLIDLIGKTFGELEVIHKAKNPETNHTEWLCRCSCGNEKRIKGYSLLQGHYKSCGCKRVIKRDKGVKQHIDRDSVQGTRKSALKAKLHANNSSGVKGVMFLKSRGKWKAYIGFKGKQITLGYFEKLEDAVAARRLAEEKYHKPILEGAQE